MDEHYYCSSLDIAPDGSSASARGIARRAALLNSAFWGRGARLTVGFLEGSISLQRRVETIAQRWPSETNADFSFEFWIDSPRDATQANIRISFRPGKGSWSVLGNYARRTDRSKPTMNLGWMTTELAEEKADAVVLHEFGHALGLIHEHLNPVQIIDWNVENVRADLKKTQGWDDATIDANMFAHPRPEDVFATDVDALSIMMYPIPPSWTNNGFTTGFNSRLTDTDKALIRAAYGPRSPFAAG
jgi:serralysin